jgi:maltooligosyltrehalose trehalohydrolase
MEIGAHYYAKGRKCEFIVWAPYVNNIELRTVSPHEEIIPLIKDRLGYWKTVVRDLPKKTRYFYRIDSEKERPDPASHFQPMGVHGPSQLIDHRSFKWEDNGWHIFPLSEMIIYELHVGTFTDKGTFDAIIPHLSDLIDLGVNAIEIMPVSQFPGDRNWGYDGTYPFSVQNSYGGPEGLKRLVNECHKKDMAVILDVVYNHLGPEGNYFRDYGPYFTDKYSTPWGQAINFDDAYSNEVRNFFIENALHWVKNYHIDALRLDAIHGIFDLSATPFLQELSEKVDEFSACEKRKVYLIAESDLNDSRVIIPGDLGGFGFHAQWCDDFHHCIHTLLTGESAGYYMDFGKMEHLVKSIKEGFVYSGEYSRFRMRNRGNSSKDRPADQFIVFSQNHDQIGNRAFGERLARLVSFETLKLAAGIVLLSPYIPLLYMGEEYGEDSPFLYFISHTDPDLIEAVRKGRKKEFKAFTWKEEPPDPQNIETFKKSKIQWDKRRQGHHRVLLDFYTYLIQLRRKIPALSSLDKNRLIVSALEEEKILFLKRWKDENCIFCMFNFNTEDLSVFLDYPDGVWFREIDSSEKRWNGPGSFLPEEIQSKITVNMRGRSFAVYRRKEII